MDLRGCLVVAVVILHVCASTALPQTDADKGCFQEQYVKDKAFAEGFSFANVSDIAINTEQTQVWVLQRSHPPVTVWNSETGTFLFAWNTQEIGYPHSITLNGSDPASATVWITDMAGNLASGEKYGHCLKQFTYFGKYIQSIGECGWNTNGSGLNPPQFDRVTDIALNSKGYLYVTDGDVGGINNRVLVFDSDLRLVDVWNKENKPGTGPLQFNLPHSICTDRCDRVWIVDTKNHRIQIVTSEGVFLGQWDCFGMSLIYGIDIHMRRSSIVLTTVNSDGKPEILFLPFPATDCAELHNFGDCRIERRLLPKANEEQSIEVNSFTMLHSVVLDDDTGAMYLAELPGNLPPLKFIPAQAPPAGNSSACSGYSQPPLWKETWSATVLLTPFNASVGLMTAEIAYSAQLRAMYVELHGPNSAVHRYLNKDNDTYLLQGQMSCSGPHNFGWVTPSRQWLADHKCQCKGAQTISEVETVAWGCPTSELIDWFWFNRKDNTIWRIFFNRKSNTNHLPVLGNFTMVHFTSHGSDIAVLLAAYDACVERKLTEPSTSYQSLHTDSLKSAPFVKGFSYSGCSQISDLPKWPEQFYLTVTMLPVGQNNFNPLPTSVLYDWQRQSQRTTMCEGSLTYNAYLTKNNTYIVNQDLKNGSIECLSRLKFGPPVPGWMAQDNCKCMGTISVNPTISPWHFTAIVVCPLVGSRVFWAWFTTDTGYSPLLFFETESPAGEGTNLALADYHRFYSEDILVDSHEFEVPSKCL